MIDIDLFSVGRTAFSKQAKIVSHTSKLDNKFTVAVIISVLPDWDFVTEWYLRAAELETASSSQ